MLSEIQAIQAGDPQATARFIAAHEAMIQSWVARMMLGCGQDASDVVQDALVEIFTSIRTVRGGVSSVTPWMRTVARNVVCQYFRKERYQNRLDYHDPHELEVGTYTTDAALNQDVKLALAGLPPDDVELLVQRHVEGMAVRELASSLDMSNSTVKRRLRRDALRLRKRLSDAQSRR